jgi:lysine 2,3-aminomutase
MSSDASLEKILEAVYQMALRKKDANRNRPEREKYAEILRVRLGTRIPAYLPHRVTPELVQILSDFQAKARKIGIRQFIIQTHFESPMEVTPEARDAVARLLAAGWTITNQNVFTAAGSRRGHTAKLRQVLGDIGVLPYYTFSVKGYMENWHNFATNGRAVQEQMEERIFGKVGEEYFEDLEKLPEEPEKMVENIADIRAKSSLPFLATDRSVLNLPGVGKSLTFRVIGITRYGRRILEFDHDSTRDHSPIIEKMGKVIIVESKSVNEYLQHLEEIGEDISDYQGLYGYSIGVTEPRMPLYQYPDYEFELTEEITNLDLEGVAEPATRG